MVSTFISSRLSWTADKLGDGFLYVLDELKFWGEVMTEFFELDETSSDRHLSEMRERVREQIDETEEYEKEVELIKQARKKQGDDDDDDGSSSEEEKREEETEL